MRESELERKIDQLHGLKGDGQTLVLIAKSVLRILKDDADLSMQNTQRLEGAILYLEEFYFDGE